MEPAAPIVEQFNCRARTGALSVAHCALLFHNLFCVFVLLRFALKHTQCDCQNDQATGNLKGWHMHPKKLQDLVAYQGRDSKSYKRCQCRDGCRPLSLASGIVTG